MQAAISTRWQFCHRVPSSCRCRTCRCASPGTTPTGRAACAPRRTRTTRARSSRTSRRRRTPRPRRRSRASPGRRSIRSRRALTSAPDSCDAKCSRTCGRTTTRGTSKGAHAHFAADRAAHAPYSLEVTPFRWVMLEEHERYSEPWGIGSTRALEDRARQLMTFDEDTWIQDHRNQLALLDSFFSALRPAEVARPPLRQGPAARRGARARRALSDRRRLRRRRRSGGRVGVLARGRAALGHVGARRRALDSARQSRRLPLALPRAAREPGAAGNRPRAVRRSRPAGALRRVLLRLGAGDATTARSPRSPSSRASSISCPAWSTVRGLRSARGSADRLADAWHARGPYPGMGPMLAAAGLDRGPLLARRVLDDLPDGSINPWPELEQAIAREPRRTRRAPGAQGLGAADRRRCALPPAAGHVAVRAHRRAGTRAVRQPRRQRR